MLNRVFVGVSVAAIVIVAVDGFLANGAAAAQSGQSLISAPGNGAPVEDGEARIARQLEDGVAAAQRGDYAAAFRLWRPIAKAQYALGIMHINGKGVARDDGAAVKWFRSAAEQGFLDAQFNLGVAYLAGKGAPQNDAEAAKWFRLAAEQNQIAAQFNLGRAYSIGQGIERDVVLAHMWLSLSLAGGNDSAGGSLDTLAREMTPEQIAEAERLTKEWKPVAER